MQIAMHKNFSLVCWPLQSAVWCGPGSGMELWRISQNWNVCHQGQAGPAGSYRAQPVACIDNGTSHGDCSCSGLFVNFSADLDPAVTP